MQNDQDKARGELEIIAHVCKRLKKMAVGADRKFLAHLLDLTITECKEKPVMPISDLRAIAAQMRRAQLEAASEEQSRGGADHRAFA